MVLITVFGQGRGFDLPGHEEGLGVQVVQRERGHDRRKWLVRAQQSAGEINKFLGVAVELAVSLRSDTSVRVLSVARVPMGSP